MLATLMIRYISEFSRPISSIKSVEHIKTFRYESYVRSQPNPSKNGNVEVTSRIQALKRPASIDMTKGSTRHVPFVAMNTGAEREVGFGVVWHKLHFSDKSVERTRGGSSKECSTYNTL